MGSRALAASGLRARTAARFAPDEQRPGRYTECAFGPIPDAAINHSHARDPKVVPTVFDRSVLARAEDPT
jgi:hypothetical protein